MASHGGGQEVRGQVGRWAGRAVVACTCLHLPALAEPAELRQHHVVLLPAPSRSPSGW